MGAPAAARLRLTLTNDSGDDALAASASVQSTTSSSSSSSSASATGPSSHWFEQEGTKASYIIGPSSSGSSGNSGSSSDCGGDSSAAAKSTCNALRSIGKPAHAVLECSAGGGDRTGDVIHPFRYGGLELMSNARNVEVYVTDADTGKERYVFTSRGIKAGIEDEGRGGAGGSTEWFKCVVVNPGGPATVMRVRLKLLSLKPNKCTECSVRSVKVKAKLPVIESAGTERGQDDSAKAAAPVAATASPGVPSASTAPLAPSAGAAPAAAVPPAAQLPAAATAAAAGRTPLSTPNRANSSPLPEADVGAALSAVTMMVRSTEDRIRSSIADEANRLDSAVAARLLMLERKVDTMGAVIGHQNDKLNEQARIIGEQREMLSEQRKVMDDIVEGQRNLMGMMEGMATAFSMTQIQAVTAPVAMQAQDGGSSTQATGTCTGCVVRTGAESCDARAFIPTNAGECGDIAADNAIKTKSSNDLTDMADERTTESPSDPDGKYKDDAPESPSEGWIKVKDDENEGEGSESARVDGMGDSRAGSSGGVRDIIKKGDETKQVGKREPVTKPVMTYRGATDLISFDNDDAGAGIMRDDAPESIGEGVAGVAAAIDLLLPTTEEPPT